MHAATAHPLYQPLLALVEHSYGPLIILTELIHGISGIDDAYIFGSWAARRFGQQGVPPADIDVLLIGSIDFETADSIAERATSSLRMDVNVHRSTTDLWIKAEDPFTTTVKSQPLVRIPLE